MKYFIPSFIIMIIIFIFSAQSGSESSQLSNSLLLWIQNTFNITIPSLLIRKCAHMSEYALLTFTFIYAYKKNNSKYYLLAAFISTVLYACSDEFHQLFVESRSGNFLDVCIDSFGALIANMIYKIKITYIHH